MAGEWLHDSRISCNSKINEMLRNCSIPSLPRVLVPDTDPVPICVLGDPAYPLLPYLMKAFPRGVIVLHAWSSNVPSADLREDLERWYLPHVIHSCVILHNYCEVNGDHISNEAIDKAIKYDGSFNLALQLLGIKVQWLLGVNRFVKFLWNISTNNAANPNWPIAKNFQTGSKWLCLVTPSQKFGISEITPNRHHLTLCCGFKCSKLLLPLPLILSDSFLFIPVQQDISSVHLGHVFIPRYLCWSC